MLTNKFHFVWFKLRLEGNHHFHISFPIPLYIFQELLDSILDLLEFAYFFAPKKSSAMTSSPVSISSVRALVEMMMRLIDSLSEDEPFDFVDVTADKVKLSLKIR
jgi:hypothetical protein